MKKFLIISLAVILCSTIVVFYFANNRTPLEDLFNANVEALTQNEANVKGHCHDSNNYAWLSAPNVTTYGKE